MGLRGDRVRPARFLIGVIGGLVGIAAVLLVLLVAADIRFQPKYDEGHRDYQHFARVFERISGLDLASSSASDWTVDFSPLASGNWQIVCLFGGYTDPLKSAEERGWSTAEVDRDRLNAVRHGGFRLAIVEEFEALIAYVDQLNNAEFIHFKHGIGVAGQHLEACISRPETRLALDAMRRSWAGQ
jgi:hypothetical protein